MSAEGNATKSGRSEDAPAASSTWRLTWLILAGLVLGGIVGQGLFAAYEGQVPDGVLDVFFYLGDTLFMSLLRMILVPLVASSVIVGVSSIGDRSRLGRVGGLTVLYYFATMVVAVLLGIVLVTSIRPGDPARDGSGIGATVIAEGETAYAEQSVETQSQVKAGGEGGLWGALKSITQELIPRNPVGAAAEGRLLPVIAFSLLIGVVLTFVGRRGQPLLDVFDAAFAVIMRLVDWILWIAPVGVFALVVWTVAPIGLGTLAGPLLRYVLAVLVGLAIHGLVVLPLVLWVFGRTNPYRYLHQMRAALLTAFGADSSSAALPVTIESAEDTGVSKQAARFVLPLGATINMDGTALYEAVAVVFLFQSYAIPLGGTELAIVVITATLAAVGAAGIPSAGLVTMAIVVVAVNDSLGGDKTLPLAAVGIIIGIDRILDMCRTTVNVWGDAVGAKIISRLTDSSPS